MGRVKIDLTNQVFHDLTALEEDFDYAEEHKLKNKKRFWKCQCKCGKIITVAQEHLRSGHTQRCRDCSNKKNKIDLTGQRFGKLLVLKEDLNYKKEHNIENGNSYWECICDCGKTVTLSYIKLKNENVQQCKYCNNEYKTIDLTGKIFDDLKVLERDFNYTKEHNLKTKRPYWKCQCSCGKIFSVCGGNLTKANNPTRRCPECGNKNKIKDLIGLTFGKLTVLEIVGRSKDRHVLYKCKCECGNEIIISGNELIQHHTSSCGCIKSLGEYTIIQILNKNNIPYKTQKVFDNCRFPELNTLARFDFYINNSFLLEFDGIQHFKFTSGWNNEENLEKTKKRDNFKNQWCKENGIILKRIPYWDLDKITINDIMGDKYNVS